jgi:hypothetical protein
MSIEPRLRHYKEGERLTLNSVNSIIRRIEYGAELANGLRLIAGEGITFEGGRIKALKQDEYPALPIGVRPPINPIVLTCTGSIGWSKTDYFGFDVCPTIGPPCGSGVASCAGRSVSGYIVSSAVWPKSCLASRSPICAFSATFDDSGTLGDFTKPYEGCVVTSSSGIITPAKGSYDAKTFFLYVRYTGINGPQGGPYGFIGNGSFSLV